MGYNAEQSQNSCSVPVIKVKEKDRHQEHLKAFDSSSVVGLGSPGQRHRVTNALITEILHPYHRAFRGWHMGEGGEGWGKDFEASCFFVGLFMVNQRREGVWGGREGAKFQRVTWLSAVKCAITTGEQRPQQEGGEDNAEEG